MLNPFIWEGCPCPLDDILEAKEKRQYYQSHLIETHRNTLICLTLVTPGNLKHTLGYRYVFYHTLALFEAFCVSHNIIIQARFRVAPNTGLEAYWVTSSLSAEKIKSLMIQFEETTDFGRLCDFDVISQKGIILSRRDLNLPPRRCFICNEDAHICTRSQRHEYQTVLHYIEELIGVVMDKTRRM